MAPSPAAGNFERVSTGLMLLAFLVGIGAFLVPEESREFFIYSSVLLADAWLILLNLKRDAWVTNTLHVSSYVRWLALVAGVIAFVGAVIAYVWSESMLVAVAALLNLAWIGYSLVIGEAELRRF